MAALYYPIVRWKQAEKDALRLLTDTDRQHICPVIEFVMPAPKRDRKNYKIIMEDSRSLLVKKAPLLGPDISKHWGRGKALVDVHLLESDLRAPTLEEVLAYSAQHALDIVPVIYIFPRLSTEPDHMLRNISVRYAKTSEKGLCIRIQREHFSEETFAETVQSFLRDAGLSPSGVDLLVDLGIVTEDENEGAILAQLSAIPLMQSWRSFTVCGGAFPRDLSELEKHSHEQIARSDMALWRDLVSSKGLERKPFFSDYTVQHPIVFEAVPGLNISASIRYTNDGHWEVLRGEGLRNEKGAGYLQYPAQAKLLMEQGFYRGPDFSYGDGYISDVATGKITTPGSPTTWLRAGINHHLTLTARQLSNSLVDKVPL
jgi:hypothetical protein